jgi:hypothetical protein
VLGIGETEPRRHREWRVNKHKEDGKCKYEEYRKGKVAFIEQKLGNLPVFIYICHIVFD